MYRTNTQTQHTIDVSSPNCLCLRWDANGDGKLDNSDLSYIIYWFYGSREGDANWDMAKLYDVNNDGIVNAAEALGR